MKLFTWICFAGFSIALAITACQPKTAGPQIVVESAWGRPSPAVASAGAFYMTIKNSGNETDSLLSANSPACGAVELHESYMKEDGTMGMRMVHGSVIEIPAGGFVELKVGGLHAMCIIKQAEFVAGDRYTLTLNFQKSGAIEVEVEIKEP